MKFGFPCQEELGRGEAVLSGSNTKGAKGDVQVGEFRRLEDMLDGLDRSLGKAIRGRVCYRR